MAKVLSNLLLFSRVMSENKEKATGTIESPIIVDECDDVEVERSGSQFRSPVKVVPGNQFRYVCKVFIC